MAVRTSLIKESHKGATSWGLRWEVWIDGKRDKAVTCDDAELSTTIRELEEKERLGSD